MTFRMYQSNSYNIQSTEQRDLGLPITSRNRHIVFPLVKFCVMSLQYIKHREDTSNNLEEDVQLIAISEVI
ncbi:hypothetical protein SERLA73DRAFT_180986 [Serpula lacrymans var. lacrymans S7.3]|uniref:Uncharacterized protein n=2 Tax=Serpula lacrymans var. lacrymans TaxID=341189 RepID=F8PU98_SERL3|nr:uncharacterized protein SERLADRAFT_448859 [Serpula lacrymans var. lacrymans S7.9]EGO00411.1 hypothetical protein SERLA73DRAFT_180986 [Serpula lacrymans var. lacrymans S7.3]EGO25967.1 hypothetical protein SERLADRAFT_448859 [Serpula lacrymans var. lacrymans S7.9]